MRAVVDTGIPPSDLVREELESWLDEQWDARLSARRWWRRLAEARWTAPALPVPAGGRGWPSDLSRLVRDVLDDRGVLGPPDGVGLVLAAPTIARFGTGAQVARFLPAILAGEEAWCQLFSEPDAGSDLAALTTRAVPEGDGWRVDGRKVWTSLAQYADWGMLLARTDSQKPKHRGLTWFALPMDQPGIEVRPLREATGEAFFNEVFIDGARVPPGCVVGAVDDGWRITLSTLADERAGVGTGLTRPVAALPGERAGALDRPAGELLRAPALRTTVAVDLATHAEYVALARRLGRDRDPVVRQGLVRLWSMLEIDRLAAERSAAVPGPGDANLGKLRFAELYRLAREIGTGILGPWATCTDPGGPGGDLVQRITVFSPVPAIAGGTDQIQRNIVAERVLGLPRDPGR
jgi:alkylation response protein AidB-like acyl-CoA dehydrogenase